MEMTGKNRKITPIPARGMRDHLPEEVLPRMEVIDKLRSIFESYGFLPLETPAMERIEVLTGKYGDESEKLIFKVMKRGEELLRALEGAKDGIVIDRQTKTLEVSYQSLAQIFSQALPDLGLRYDLTVSLARVVAQYGGKIAQPFKRYQIAPVWRADRPQRGRFREFIQCDVDIVGSDSLLADAEIISLAVEVYRRLNMSAFEVLVNHRGLLKALNSACGNPADRYNDFCTAIDKLDKIGRDGVGEEMAERGLDTSNLKRFWKLAERSCYINEADDLDALLADMNGFIAAGAGGSESIEQLRELFALLRNLGAEENIIRFDPALARGLDYYTGPVFEVVGRDRSIGSLGGGGRYDELVGMFSNRSIPATGTSFGLDRIVEVLIDQNVLAPRRTTLNVEIIDLSGNDMSAAYCGRILKILRREGVSCDLGYGRGKKAGKQMKSADRRNIPFVIIVGEDEVDDALTGVDDQTFSARAGVTVRRLSDGEQRRTDLSATIRWIKESV